MSNWFKIGWFQKDDVPACKFNLMKYILNWVSCFKTYLFKAHFLFAEGEEAVGDVLFPDGDEWSPSLTSRSHLGFRVFHSAAVSGRLSLVPPEGWRQSIPQPALLASPYFLSGPSVTLAFLWRVVPGFNSQTSKFQVKCSLYIPFKYRLTWTQIF